MKINGTLAVLTTILISLPVALLRAQPAAVQQMQNTQAQQQQQQNLMPSLVPGTNAPELYPGENSDIGPQRILKLNPSATPFEVFLDSEVFYTDNATFAADGGRIGSAVFVNTVQATYSPEPYKSGQDTFAPSIGFSSQWYNYDRTSLNNLDFNAQTIFINGRYSLGNNWQISGGANYTRLLNQHNYDETYRELVPELGVQRDFQIGDTMLFTVGDQIDYHFTQVPSVLGSPAYINDRFDDTLNFAFTWQMTRRLIAQPYYRFQYSHYQDNTGLTSTRDDFLHTFGVTLAYYFNQYASVRAFFNYSVKQTDDPLTPAYHEDDGGVGASLDFKF